MMRSMSGGSSNWVYYGVPGESDAYAPGNAVVDAPGGTPMMPTPPPQPPR